MHEEKADYAALIRPTGCGLRFFVKLNDPWILHPYCIADGENVIANRMPDDLRASQRAPDKAIFGYVAGRGIEHHE